MKRRVALAFAVPIAALIAPAAPVPKESGEARLKRIFGTVADPDSRVTCEAVGKEGVKITAPAVTKAHADGDYVCLDPSMQREIKGDFTLTVQVMHTLDANAKPADEKVAAYVGAGLTVKEEGKYHGVRLISKRDKEGAGWRCGLTMCRFNRTGGGGFGNGDTLTKPVDAATWLRLTRTVNEFTAETSADGKEWSRPSSTTIALNETLLVGPVVYHSTAGEYSATFDHYTITQPTDAKK